MTVGERQKRASTSDGNGGRIKLQRMDCALLCGTCPTCGERTYVCSNQGQMLCAHCGQQIPDWQWGRVEPVFVPEDAC